MEIGLTNTYLAEGETSKAEAELCHPRSPNEYHDDYDYMMAAANLYRQRQERCMPCRLSRRRAPSPARKIKARGKPRNTRLAGEEGRQILTASEIFPEASFCSAAGRHQRLYAGREDPQRNESGASAAATTSFQSLAESHYRIHLGPLPVISGFLARA